MVWMNKIIMYKELFPDQTPSKSSTQFCIYRSFLTIVLDLCTSYFQHCVHKEYHSIVVAPVLFRNSTDFSLLPTQLAQG